MKIRQVIDFVEDYSKPGFNALWSFVVNVMRPFSSGMGLRVAGLGPNRVQIVVPDWLRNKDENSLHEATYLTAAKEGFRLWIQRLVGPATNFELQQILLKASRPIRGQARVEFQIEDLDKEIFLHQLQQEGTLEKSFSWSVLDESEKKCAEVELKVLISTPIKLEASSTSIGKKTKEKARVRH